MTAKLLPQQNRLPIFARPDRALRVVALLGFAADTLTGENMVGVYRRYGIDLLAYTALRLET